MKEALLAALARTSIGAIAIATAVPTLAHGADEQAAATATAAAQVASPAQGTVTTTAPTAEDEKAAKDIVVTGSQIRGATQNGTSLLTTTAAQAEEQGAVNGNEILAQLPQAANVFQGLPSIAGGTPAGFFAAGLLPFQSVTLRNLPNVNTGGSALTLSLIDGHRAVPVGDNSLSGQAVDPLTISAATLLRTEIMPDGGSAIYGSDAVAGVINYVTRDSFDGLQVQARGGIAGKYKQGDGSIIAGTNWATGGVYASISYSAHDALFGYERDYMHAVDANPNSPLYQKPLFLNCFAPNIAITTAVGGVSSRRLYPLAGGPNGAIQPFTTNGGTNGNGTTSAGIAGGNRCDQTDYQNFYPKQKAINAAFGLKQEITDTLTFSLKGNWERHSNTTYNPLTLTATVLSSNQNYRPVCNAPPSTVAPICGTTPGFFLGDNNQTQTVTTDYTSVLGPTAPAYITVQTWQVTPSLSWNFAKDWQVRGLVSYGESRTEARQAGADATLVAARVASGLINPYNLPGSGAGAFDRLVTFGDRIGAFHLLDTRVVADGPVPGIHLPAGDIRAAVGAEYFKTDLILSVATLNSPTPNNFVLDQQNPGGLPLRYSQNVKSAFGELQLPLVSEDMNIPLISSFNVSGSVRYDKYNDFGDSFNKMVGATWAPVPWLKIRSNWNTSFAAPNNLTELATFTGAALNNSNQNGAATPLAYFQGTAAPGGTNASAPLGIGASLTSGTKKGIGPQTSKSLSIGFDMSPPIVPGLSFGMSYYDLKISNAIGSPVQPNTQSVFDQHPELIYCHGGVKGSDAGANIACATPFASAELLAADPGYAVAANPITGGGGLATATSLVGSGSGSTVSWPTVFANYCEPAAYTAHSCAAGTYTVFYLIDNRNTNLGFVFSRGIDFHAAYRTKVPWGTVDASVSGTYNLATKTQAGKLALPVDTELTGFSKWRMTSSLATNWGPLRAQITWQHSAGYDLSAAASGTVGTAVIPGTAAYGQTHVGSFNTFDLFFRYKFDDLDKENGLFRGLSLTLNVNNVFDQDPPVLGGGFTNGTTLGRMFMLGITKTFK